MKYLVNIEDMKPDEDERSLRGMVKDRQREILRDTYFLIDPEKSPSKNLKMGYTIVYPTGRTTGHVHDDMEEVYFILSGKGKMVVGDDEFREVGSNLQNSIDNYFKFNRIRAWRDN